MTLLAVAGSILGGLFGRSKQKVISAGDNRYSDVQGIMRAAKDFGFNPLTLLTQGQAIGPTVTTQDNSAFGAGIANAFALAGDAITARRAQTQKLNDYQNQNRRLMAKVNAITLRSPVPGVYGTSKMPSDPEVYGNDTFLAPDGGGSVSGGPAGSPAGLEPLREVHPFDPRRGVDNVPMKSHSGWITIDNPATGPMNVPSLDGDEALSLGEYPTALYAWATRERGIGFKAFSAMRDGTWRKAMPTVRSTVAVQNPLLDSVKRYGRKGTKRNDPFRILGFQ